MTRKSFAAVVAVTLLALGVSAAPQKPAATAPLLRAGDLVYVGAFKVPHGQQGVGYQDNPRSPNPDNNTLSYGGVGIAFNPPTPAAPDGSLFLVGHPYGQMVIELAVPTTFKDASGEAAAEGGLFTKALALLPTATRLQNGVDATEGKLNDVRSSPSENVTTGGLLVHEGKLYQSAYVTYDANGRQSLSHFVRSPTLGAPSVTGPFRIGLVNNAAGFYSGYMGVIPPQWRSALGGTILVGNCCISIISRTSYGPAAFAVDPADIGVRSKAPVPLVSYPSDHQTLAPYGADSRIDPYFNGSTSVRGVVLVPDTSTVLFFGRHGLGDYCYGQGTADKGKHRQPEAGKDPSVVYCYDPAVESKGNHAYPYKSYIWAYDANELAQVRARKKRPWDVKPYAVWPLTLPFANVDLANELGGATFDPIGGRLFVSQLYTDSRGAGSYPLIHVFTIKKDKS